MTTDSTEWFILEVISYTIPAICIPLAIYHNIKLYSRKNEMFVQKRSLPILFSLNLWIVCSMIAITFTEFAVFHSSYDSISQLISFNIYLISWWLILYFLVIKNWLLHYKYHWTYYTLQSEWQRLINATSTSQNTNTNWFIKNNKTYGNLSYIYKRFGILSIIGILVCLIGELKYVFDAQYHVIDVSIICLSISMSPAVIFYIIIVNKTPSIDDPFFIHWESKSHAKTILLMCITFLIMEIFAVFIHYYNVLMIADPILEVLLFTLNYISTASIMSKNKSESARKSATLGTEVLDILSNTSALHEFMVHLSKEYSMECLLSVIEFEQYQRYIKQIDPEIDGKVNVIVLDSSIPVSEIIECEEKVDEDYDGDKSLYICKMKAHKIYNKYVKVSSEFEINIAWTDRNDVQNVVENLDELINQNITLTDMYILFEVCKKQMMCLLEYSLYRFRSTSEYVTFSTSNKNSTV